MNVFVPTLLGLSIAMTGSLTCAMAQEPTVPVATTEAVASSASMSTTELAEVEQAMAASAQPEPVDPGMEIETAITNYKRGGGRGFVQKARQGSLYFGVGQASVMLLPEDREWGNARVMAYKEALLNAKANYLEFLGFDAMSKAATRLFKDPSQMPHFDQQELASTSKLGELLDKAVAVADGMLNEKLVEMGIDPAEFHAAPTEKRAVMFERSVSNQVTQRARHELTGVIPVKSFEANDADGNHVVAVAVVASPKMRAFIDDVIRSKGDVAPDPAKASPVPLDELFADNTGLINEFGIRRMYDEQGYPVLVSFGQSGNPYRGNDYQERYDNRAVSFAAAQAEAVGNFATLFKSTGTLTQSTSNVMSNRRVGIARADGRNVSESEESTREFIQTLEREMESTGRVTDLAGTSELTRWTVKHPVYGHELNGVIYVWHPVAEQNARDLRNYTPTPAVRAPKAEQNRGGQAGASQSKNLMSADDF